MIIKLNPIVQVFSRRRDLGATEQLTRKDWVNADRIVMLILFIGVIIGAVVFS